MWHNYLPVRAAAWVLGGLFALTAPLQAALASDDTTALVQLLAPTPTLLPGQSATQLSDGRWLLLGGGADGAVTGTATLLDATTGQPLTLPVSLATPRTGHSATLLPDGTVLILGGMSADGLPATQAERFDPVTQQSHSLGNLGLLVRAGHTVTVLADGRLLIAGGHDAQGNVLSQVELFDVELKQVERFSSRLTTARWQQVAALLPSKQVLLWGGQGSNGQVLENGDLLDSKTQRASTITLTQAIPLAQTLRAPAAPSVLESLPANGAGNVPVDQRLMLRLSKRMAVSSFNPETVTLIGPAGAVAINPVAVEGGLLLFVTPRQELLPASQYTLFVQGATDETGQTLPFTAIGFKTGVLKAGARTSNKGGVAVAIPTPTDPESASPTQVIPVASAVAANVGAEPDERWIPSEINYYGSWTSARRHLARNTLPKHDYLRTKLHGDPSAPKLRPGDVAKAMGKGKGLNQLFSAPAQAPVGETAITGQVLKLNGYPLANATLSIGEKAVRTDSNGEFVLSGVPSGRQVLVIDGSSADHGNFQYGRYEYGLEVAANEENALPFVIWMSALDRKGDQHIPSPLKKPAVITNPAIPGLELHLPAGAVIRDADGKIVTSVNLTAIPVDQPPFPLPPNAPVPVYFTIQPGGAHLSGIDAKSAQGAQLIYPNFTNQLPGERVDFWNYDPAGKGWYRYGQGTVSKDGKQVVPDAGVVIYEFTGAMISVPSGAPEEGPPVSDEEDEEGEGGDETDDEPTPLIEPADEIGAGGGGQDPCDGVAAASASMRDEQDPLYALQGILPSAQSERISYVQDEQGDFTAGSRFDRYLAADIRWGSNQPTQLLSKGGDPVDLNTGLFLHRRTDMAVRDVIPIAVSRVYRQRDSRSRGVGVGANLSYDMFLIGDTYPWTYIQLVMPDGGRLDYPRISPGTEWTQAVYQNTSGPTRFFGSIIQWDTSVSPYVWSLTLKDGTIYRFYEAAGSTNPRQSAVGQIEDRNGNVVTLTRDSTYNLTKITSPSGRSITLTYGTGNRLATATDDIGRTVQYSYDTSGRLATVTDPLNHTETYTYDSNHNMLTVTDWRGNVMVTNEYDTNNRVKKQTYPGGSTNEFTYALNAYNKVTQAEHINRRGITRSVTFDTVRGYVTGVNRAAGRAVAQSITAPRLPSTSLVNFRQDTLSRKRIYEYDVLGNTTRVTNLAETPKAIQTNITYEPKYSKPKVITDGLNRSINFDYDARGNLTKLTNRVGQQTTFTRDAQGRITKVKNPLNQETTLNYTGPDLTSVTDAHGHTTYFYYDGVGRVRSVINPLGKATFYEYDALDRVITITNPLGKTISFTYDNNGNRLSQTDENGNTTTFTYDAMNRLLTEVDALNRTTTWEYETSGRVSRKTDRNGNVTGYTYDDLGRVTQVGYGGTVTNPTTYTSTVTNTWDAANRLTQVVDSLSGTITRSYDDLNRLTQEVTPQGTVDYTYDAIGRRTSMTVQSQPTVSYVYDNNNRLTSMTQAAGASNGNVAQVVSFTHDAANRLTQKTLPNGTTATYGYDNASQLTAITYRKSDNTLIGDLTYAYDAAGRRTGIGGSLAQVNFPGSVTSTTYNANNQLTAWDSQGFTYDQNGNLTSDGVNTYTWNERNQLMGISGGVSASFSYDTFGRRIGKTVGSATTGYVYDGLNFVQEKDGTGSSANVTANLLTGGIDQVFLRSDGSALTTFLTDALGSTLALSNAGEAIVNNYSYEPYGATTPTGTSSNTQQYTGRENDGTGLYYYRARYFDSMRGRFVSEDPTGWASGQTNAYGYVGGNPLSYVDPLGLAWVYSTGTHSLGKYEGGDGGTGAAASHGSDGYYSGNGAGLNNPGAQSIENVGPTPEGMYTIGEPFKHPKTGPYTMRLYPSSDTDMHGRSGFMIHGDNGRGDQSASEGCIILPYEKRKEIWESGDHTLIVTP